MLTFRRPHSRIVISYLLSILLPLMNGGLMFKIMQNETRLDYANVLGASVAVAGIVMVGCIYFLILKDEVKIRVNKKKLIYYQFGKLEHIYYLKDYQIKAYEEGLSMALELVEHNDGRKIKIDCRPLGRENYEILVQMLTRIKTNT
ncbi:hypothetical protein [Erysipelothrix rhusiopathiae]|nr:hypothetical protein [Erysipelothrix rhusiopathiae]MDV7680722.1 hypothetical protein [Erysipelothrix rhusiopathiae]VEH83877.1 Uncharacterised protein [Erysipelothrix rhusiopathiae]